MTDDATVLAGIVSGRVRVGSNLTRLCEAAQEGQGDNMLVRSNTSLITSVHIAAS